MNPFGGAVKMEKSAHAQTSLNNGTTLTIHIITNIGPIETILFLNHIYIQCAIYSTYFQPYTSYIGDATDDGSNTIVILWFYLFFLYLYTYTRYGFADSIRWKRMMRAF